MSASDLQRDRESSQHWNEDVLSSLGFRRVANTTIFRNAEGVAILSPGVGKPWFDIRQANLDKLGESFAGVVLRFVPDGFAVIPRADFAPHLDSTTARESRKGGRTYGFRCRADSGTGTIHLIASSNRDVSFTVAMLDRGAATQSIQSLAGRRPI